MNPVGEGKMGRVEGKVAFITGAARGQGRAHAVRLAQEGADIIAVDLAAELPGVLYESPSPADLEETVRQVEAHGRRIISEVADIRDLDRLRSVVDAGVAELGSLDIVVANAGICIPAVWSDVTPQMLQDHLDINVTGTWNTVMVSAQHLIDSGGGSIVLTSSYAGKKVQQFMVHYTASKHAITGMARAFAAELGQHKIRVNSIHPGAVNTPMGGGDMQAALESATASNPALGSMGTPFVPQWAAEPEEIASLVLFLASDEAQYITADAISIDGGMAQY